MLREGVSCGPGTRVTVELDWDTMNSGVLMCAAAGYGAPGLDAREWSCGEQGAVYGVRFGLRLTNSLPCAVRITEVEGEKSHTNPTVVAAAAAYAVWEALGYEPPQEIHDRISGEVDVSRQRGGDYLGLFEKPRVAAIQR